MDRVERRLEVVGVHAIMLLSIAPTVAKMFRTDLRIADLLDPAVYIAADGDGLIASVVERLELIQLISELQSSDLESIWNRSPEQAPIAVLVADKSDMVVYRVADPRAYPQQWPWMGLEDDEN
jgi:hypothetical protein